MGGKLFSEEIFTFRWVRRKSVQKGAGSKMQDREEHRLLKVNWSNCVIEPFQEDGQVSRRAL